MRSRGDAPGARVVRRILIENSYSWFNKGDAAIVLGTVEAFRRLIPDLHVTIVSMTPDSDRPRFAASGIAVVGGPAGMLYDGSRPQWRRVLGFLTSMGVSLGIAAAYRFTGRVRADRASPEVREYAAAIAASDLVVSCGGGFWSDNSRKALYTHLLRVLVPLLFGKQVVCPGVSLGPFYSRRTARLTGVVLNRTKQVVMREVESVPVARRMGMRPSVVRRGADMAFALPVRIAAPSSADQTRAGRRVRLGVTARRWIFPGSGDAAEAQRTYERELAAALDKLVQVLDADIVLLPQVIGPEDDDDRIVERRLLQRMGRADRATLVDEDLSPGEMVQLMASLDLMLATRFHSAIFSMLAGVPVVAISYEQKTTGIMTQMGLSEWTIPIESVTAKQLVSLVERLLADREAVAARIAAAVAQERADALESIAACLAAAGFAPSGVGSG